MFYEKWFTNTIYIKKLKYHNFMQRKADKIRTVTAIYGKRVICRLKTGIFLFFLKTDI